jgi:hypothetical protein
MQKPHTKPIYIGKREEKLTAPGGPDRGGTAHAGGLAMGRKVIITHPYAYFSTNNH